MPNDYREFNIGDLVEVKKNIDLSPTLRFFHNKQGMVHRIKSESMRGEKVYIIEYEILFPNGKKSSFKNYELNLIARAN